MGLGADWVCAGWGLIARQQCTPLNPASPRLGSGVRIECGIWVRIGFAQARGSLTGVNCSLNPGSGVRDWVRIGFAQAGGTASVTIRATRRAAIRVTIRVL